MKIGIYNPYLDSLSGGERYTLTLASHWSAMHDVTVFWEDATILKKAAHRLSLSLDRVHVAPNIFKRFLVQKLIATKQYDLLFILSDGSVPLSMARYNILHFQVPFSHISAHPFSLRQYQHIVCNSEFTKAHLDTRVRRDAIVIYPPVSIMPVKSVTKQNCILSVGRIHAIKKHMVLIDAFRYGVDHGYFPGWKLVIAGGLQESDRNYYQTLLQSIGTYSIEILPNVPHDILHDLYRTSTVYWHAAGYKESNPQNMEHFGITTVEAMAQGCVPFVYNAGGQPEIVRDSIDGYVWNTPHELVEKTQAVVTDAQRRKDISLSAIARSTRYGEDSFCHAYDSLIENFMA